MTGFLSFLSVLLGREERGLLGEGVGRWMEEYGEDFREDFREDGMGLYRIVWVHSS